MNTQYALITAVTPQELETLVNERLSRGWKLAGVLVYSPANSHSAYNHYVQPMVYETAI